MNPETECIDEQWLHSPEGVFREDIWYWFEDMFDVSVAEDLMYVAGGYIWIRNYFYQN